MAYYMDSDPVESLERVEMAKQQMEANLATDNITNLQEEHQMTREEFWLIIDSTLDAKNQEEQKELSEDKLKKLSDIELISFFHILIELSDEAVSGPVWGAALIFKGPNFLIDKNYDFDNFRLWLIAKGHSVFQKALINPDSLSEVVTQRDIDDRVEFEELLYIPIYLYEKKHGEGTWLLNQQIRILSDGEIEDGYFRKMGERWNFTNLNEMYKRYPNLLAGFLDCYLNINGLEKKKLGWVDICDGLVRSQEILNINSVIQLSLTGKKHPKTSAQL